MKRITQKQLAFYKLYKVYRKDHEQYINTWEFLGEVFIEELNRWEMMSYKCPTRLTDLYQENTKLLIRRVIKGKSGASYYQYKLFQPNIEKIEDVSIRVFYQEIHSVIKDYERTKEKILS